MMNFRVALVCIFTSWASLSWSAEKESDDCGYTQTEMNECAAKEFRDADAELNALYKEQMSRLENDATKKRLREAQRAWITFRDLSCSYEWPPDNRGTMGGMVIAGCKTYYSKQRIEDLKRYLECTDNGCPF